MASNKSKGKGTHWKHHEDLILVETLTEFVSKGASIFEAFPVASERLGGRRTPGACYSRWVNYLEKIYGEAIQIAQKKQQENAKKVVESIIEKQGPFEVIHETQPKVELLIPSYESRKLAETSCKIESIQDVMAFLNHFQYQYMNLQNENSQLLDELEKALQENEELKQKLAKYQYIEEQMERLQQLAAKLESVSV
jgi:predicted RNase H-like nuclease (RuvC/YqgF family)